MIETDFESCTGCGACAQKCPKQCISMTSGEFGFLYPTVEKTSCVDCRLCEKVCPINKDVSSHAEQQAYAAVHKSTEIVKSSTSGGAFTALAETVLHQGGVIFGAVMDRWVVCHSRVDSSVGLEKIRGSKYVQSRIGNAFRDAEKELKLGKLVLFSGTPCQVAGLKCYLGIEYENLFTVDIVCHGVGSQAYFDKFISSISLLYPEMKEIKFRSKQFTGWSCCSGALVMNNENGRETLKPFYYYNNYYYQYFLQGNIYRKSCYSCKYASLSRPADITLGDFWGIEKLKIPFDTKNGCSLLIVNTQNGRRLIESTENLLMQAVSIDDAIKQNDQLKHPSVLPKNRANRLREYEEMSGNEIATQYFKREWNNVLKGHIKKLLPYSLRVFLRRWRP